MFRVVILGVGPRTVVFKRARGRIRKTISTPLTAIALALTSVSVLAQQKPVPPPPSAGIEFPVVMRQKVSAGKTPVGTRIRAKLVIATLGQRGSDSAGRDLVRRGYRVRGEVCVSAIPAWRSHGLRAVEEWFHLHQGLPNGLVLPRGNAESGSTVLCIGWFDHWRFS